MTRQTTVKLIKYTVNSGNAYYVSETTNTLRPKVDTNLTSKEVQGLIDLDFKVVIRPSKYQFSPA